MFSRFVLLFPSIKCKITAWVWRFDIHASTCIQLQTPACLKWLALKGDWQRTKSVAWYSEHRRLAQENHDALPSGKMTATTILTAIQQTAFEAVFQVSFASPHQTAYACVCVYSSCCFVCYSAVHMRHCCLPSVLPSQRHGAASFLTQASTLYFKRTCLTHIHAWEQTKRERITVKI